MNASRTTRDQGLDHRQKAAESRAKHGGGGDAPRHDHGRAGRAPDQLPTPYKRRAVPVLDVNPQRVRPERAMENGGESLTPAAHSLRDLGLVELCYDEKSVRQTDSGSVRCVDLDRYVVIAGRQHSG